MNHDTLKCLSCEHLQGQKVYKRRPYQAMPTIVFEARCGKRYTSNLITRSGPEFSRTLQRDLPGEEWVKDHLRHFGCLRQCPLIPGNDEKYPDVARKCLSCGARIYRASKFCPNCGLSTGSKAPVAVSRETRTRLHIENWIGGHSEEDLAWYISGLVREGESFDEYYVRHARHTVGYGRKTVPAEMMQALRVDYAKGGLSHNGMIIKWLLELRDPRLQGTVLYAKLMKPEEGK